MSEIYDKTGRLIMLFDLVKVFHFRTKRKIYYMYKHVIGEKTINGTEFFVFSHLDKEQGTYLEIKDNQIRGDMQIVQGFVDGKYFEDRKRVTKEQQQ